MTSASTPATGPRLRAGVIGCGAISHEHLGHLARSPSARLVAVCDRSNAAATYARDRYGAEESHTDASLMLETARLDVVHVLTPPHTHADLIRRSLDAGAHVVSEKPMASTAAEIRALLDRASDAHLHLVESRNLLYNDPIIAIDRLIDGGRIGEVREVEIMLSLDLTDGPFGDPNLTGPGVALPGGAVHDFLPHLSYLFLHLSRLPGPVDEVIGRLTNASGNPRVGFDQLDALVMTGPVRGHLGVSSDLEPDSFRVAVRGTEGSVETDLFQPYLRVQGGKNTGKRAPVEQLTSGVRLAISSITNAKSKVLQHGMYHGVPRMLEELYRSMAEGRPSPITPTEIHAAALLTDRLVSLQEHSSIGEQS